MVSTAVNNVFGAIGGFCFAACLAPQIIRLAITKRAQDISYGFMALYCTGAAFLTVYLYYLDDALVAFIAILIEIVIAFITLLLKIYLDIYGPYPYSSYSTKGGSPANLKTALRQDITSFFLGAGGAPFPLVSYEAQHGAQHLLLDCTLEFPPQSMNNNTTNSATKTGNGSVVVSENAAELGLSPSTTVSIARNRRNAVMKETTQLLENCLEQAGLDVERKQMRQLPSFKSSARRMNNNIEGGDLATNDSEQHQMAFIGCKDGYTTVVWYEESDTLAADFLAAGEESAPRINAAAQEFGAKLIELYPGSTIEASVVPRLRKTANKSKADKKQGTSCLKNSLLNVLQW